MKCGSQGTEPGGAARPPCAGRRHGKSRFWMGLAFVGCIACLVLRPVTRRFELALVVGDSMVPTFSNGTLLIVDRAAYDSTDPRRGDVVIEPQTSTATIS